MFDGKKGFSVDRNDVACGLLGFAAMVASMNVCASFGFPFAGAVASGLVVGGGVFVGAEVLRDAYADWKEERETERQSTEVFKRLSESPHHIVVMFNKDEFTVARKYDSLSDGEQLNQVDVFRYGDDVAMRLGFDGHSMAVERMYFPVGKRYALGLFRGGTEVTLSCMEKGGDWVQVDRAVVTVSRKSEEKFNRIIDDFRKFDCRGKLAEHDALRDKDAVKEAVAENVAEKTADDRPVNVSLGKRPKAESLERDMEIMM